MLLSARRKLEQEILGLRVDRDRLEDQNTKLQSDKDSLSRELRDLKCDMSLMKSERDMLRNDRKTLQSDLKKATQFGRDLESSLNDLQTRYEDKYTQCHTLRVDKEDLADVLEAKRKKEALHAADIAKLTNSRANLEQELKAARAALLSSEAPSVAKLEGLNGEIRNLRTANTNLEKKVATHAHDNDYMRQQYQTASSAAATSANQIASLERQLAVAERKAKGEATRLAQINQSEELRQALSTVERQSLELVSRERLLQKQAEDLKEFKDFKRGRGGVVTRGSSVQAKSPRGGSRAGSPGVGGSSAYGGGSKVGSSGLRYGSRMEDDGK